jgi:hypothetical protein
MNIKKHNTGYMKELEGVEKVVVDNFVRLINNGLSPSDAYKTLDYLVFIKHNHEFFALSEEDQDKVRSILLSLSLVHK